MSEPHRMEEGPSENAAPQGWNPPSGGTLDAPEEGLTAIRAAFQEAARKAPAALREFPCLFATRAVLLRAVGRRLGDVIARATAHLAVGTIPREGPDLTIELWDGAETGVPWRMMASRDGQGIDYWFAASKDQRYVVTERRRELAWLDRKDRRIVGWVSDASEFNLAEQARIAYFPVLLWLHDCGLHVVHAALVAQDGCGILIAGETSQGKSTTSLCCLLGGMDFCSDDHLWLERRGGGFLGHGLYGSVNLSPPQLRFFPSLAEHAIHGKVEEKSLVFLHPLLPGRIQSTARLVALAVPRVVRAEKTRFFAAAKADAALAMVQSSMTEWSFKRMPDAAGRFQCITDLVNRLPCFHLELGQDLSDISRCVKTLIQEACR